MMVSILIPVYGVEKYIERCAISLFEQTYENIEYVFVNDCTKDHSIDIVKSVVERYPNRKHQVKIINHERNLGLGAARNTAVKAAKGDFILHVDSDDYVDTTIVEKCVKKQLEVKADVVSVGFARLGKDSVIKEPLCDYEKNDLIVAVIRHTIPNQIWGRLIRKKIYTEQNIEVSQGVNMSEDLNVLPRILFFSTKVAYIPDTLYFYECSNLASYTSSFSEKKANQIEKTFVLLKEFFAEKQPCFIEALNYRILNQYTKLLIHSAKLSGHKRFYIQMRKKISLFTKDSFKQLRLYYQIALRLKWFPLFKCFILLSMKLKQLKEM